MSTLTPIYKFVLPSPGDPTDQDIWGGELNSNFSSLDSLMQTASNSTTVAITGTYSVVAADRNTVKLLDATAGAFSVTMPDPTVVGNGFKVSFKKIDAVNSVTILPFAAETFDGAANVILSAQYATTTYVTNGVNWFLIASNVAGGSSLVGDCRNGSMYVPSASSSAVFSFDELIVVSTLGGPNLKVTGSGGLAINLSTTGAGGMDTGAAPVSGFVATYVIVKPDGTKSTLSCNVTTSSGSIYTGVNMPSGYTYSALVSIAATNASSQFSPVLILNDGGARSADFTPITELTVAVGTAPLTYTSLTITSVPPLAKRVRGNTGPTGNFYYLVALASTSGGFAARYVGDVPTNGNPTLDGYYGCADQFEMPLVTSKTLYYKFGNANSNLMLQVNGYDF